MLLGGIAQNRDGMSKRTRAVAIDPLQGYQNSIGEGAVEAGVVEEQLHVDSVYGLSKYFMKIHYKILG